MYKKFSRYSCISPMEIAHNITCPSTPMANQKESGTTELRVHQNGWADLPVPNGPSLCSPVHGRWLAHIFRDTYHVMGWWDGGRGEGATGVYWSIS